LKATITDSAPAFSPFSLTLRFESVEDVQRIASALGQSGCSNATTTAYTALKAEMDKRNIAYVRT
jgi:hypothetical protein